MPGLRRIGLMRHATAWYPGMDLELRSKSTPDLTSKGVDDVTRLAGVLKEFLVAEGADPASVVVAHVDTPQSRSTAQVLSQGLGTTVRECVPELDPRRIPATTTDEGDLVEAWKAAERRLLPYRHVIVVGHDPQLSWVARRLLPKRTLDFSLAPAELMWLTQGRPPQPLRWVFSPADDRTTAQLREKITSKMNAAKVLGSFFTALVTFAATQLLREPPRPSAYLALGSAGLALLMVATGLFFVALFRYDELLMPSRFWRASPPGASGARRTSGMVQRPPGSQAWVLYQNMVRVWNRAFVPAVLVAGGGIVLLALAFAEPDSWNQWLIAVGAVVLVVAVTTLAYRLARPTLGVND